MPPTHLLVGLGNPGRKYSGNRHNYGFMALDALLAEGSVRALSLGKLGELTGVRLPDVAGEVLALKPMTYMNLSGRAVAQVLNFYKIDPAAMLVIHDELDLPLGRIKVKQGGGTAGHNGLKSIVAETGCRDFVRIRLGIGRPAGMMDVSAWVLQDFAPAERPVVSAVLPECARAARLFLSQGLEVAMRETNGFDAAPPPAS